MCNAYTLTHSGKTLNSSFSFDGEFQFQPRFNIRPTELLPVIIQVENKGFSNFYWGTTPDFSKNKSLSEKLYTIRAEAIDESKAHHSAFESRRCIIPADGFYVWRQVSKKGQVPYRYFLDQNKVFVFAGVWEQFEDAEGKTAHTFSIITCQANELIESSGARMPVILDIKDGLNWLDYSADDAKNLLQPYPANKMGGFAVSNRINQAGIDRPNLIEPAPPADQFGNYSLFD